MAGERSMNIREEPDDLAIPARTRCLRQAESPTAWLIALAGKKPFEGTNVSRHFDRR
jgi:hypothetical protein